MHKRSMKAMARSECDLKLDIDTHRGNPIRRVNFRYKWLAYYYPDLLPARFTVYRTKKGYHFYIRLSKRIYPMPTVFIQAVLGSDWLREIRNMRRIDDRFGDWNILFSAKYDGKKARFEKYYTSYILNRVRA